MSAALNRSTTAPASAPASAFPDNRPEMVRLGRKLLLAQLAEIQFLRGRRGPSRARPVPLHTLVVKDRRGALKRRVAFFHECYANHRALQAAIARDAGSAA